MASPTHLPRFATTAMGAKLYYMPIIGGAVRAVASLYASCVEQELNKYGATPPFITAPPCDAARRRSVQPPPCPWHHLALPAPWQTAARAVACLLRVRPDRSLAATHW